MKTIINNLFKNLFLPLVSVETKQLLQNAKEALPHQFKTDNQFLGQQYAGCGATIGAMPRCDFSCRGCYLNHEANRIPAEPVTGIKQQLRVIHSWLGDGGNVQITDGEVTLRPIEDIIEIIRYARDIGLVPMLMSHGDGFRKSPDMLKRLMLESGLTEISIHIDTTQRGRSGHQYRHARSEQQLLPLRNEFSQLIRKLRKDSAKPLEVATTYTVTDENIAEIPDVIQWLCRNADVFKMISFQPVAEVGRTEKQLGVNLTVERLWAQIATGLYGDKSNIDERILHHRLFGHPDCTRFIQGIIIDQGSDNPVFQPLFRADDEKAIQLFNDWAEHYGGISYRSYTRGKKILSAINILLHHPKFILFSVLPFIFRRIREIDGNSALRLLMACLTGKTKLHYLSIVSHHFMSREQIETPLGQERINACVFKVPINNKMISMCEVNALGHRDKYYQSINSKKLS